MTVFASSAAMLAGFLLDLVFGDPRGLPHIVRGMGRLIGFLEKLLRSVFPKTPEGELPGGIFLAVLMLLLSAALPFAALFFAYCFSPWLGAAIEAFLCFQLLAVKSLRGESMKVYESLADDDLVKARKDVSMIVGRDTADLDEAGVAKAAVETVAENTTDAVVSPLFYIALGGAVLGCAYKAVNTLDSMVGYKNSRYLYFGRASAKLDDVLNFLPSRLAAALMIMAARITGLDYRNAALIYRRDRLKHASPNSAQTEAVCAGALGIRLGGDACYFGELCKKPFIGDDARPVEPEDIRRANRLMYVTAFLALLPALAVRAIGGYLFAVL